MSEMTESFGATMLFEAMRDRATKAEGERDDARNVLTELLRLYDWRKELGQDEARVRRLEEESPSIHTDMALFYERKALRVKLNQYGREKAAAWTEARKVLEG